MRKSIPFLLTLTLILVATLVWENSVLAQAKSSSVKSSSAKPGELKPDVVEPDPSPAKPDRKVGSDYKIAPSDILVVDVVGEPSLQNKERRVSSSGTITFPYLEGQELKVEGKTTVEVERELRDLLMKDYFVKPEVAVAVKEYRKRTVTVIGEVNNPGTFEFPGEQEINILEAIGHAKGFSKLASKSKITITRNGEQLKFNLNDWLKTSDKSKIFTLQPGDVIFVPESAF